MDSNTCTRKDDAVVDNFIRALKALSDIRNNPDQIQRLLAFLESVEGEKDLDVLGGMVTPSIMILTTERKDE